MLNKVRTYLNNNKNLRNIFLVYFFLTFVIGYLDFDRRVSSFEESTECLRQVVTGEMGLQMASRILIPYTVYFVHKISHVPLNYTYAFFRFIFFFLAFILFHIYLKKWFGDRLAMIGTLSLIASLPVILTNWYSIPTDMPELISFILGAMWIRDKKYKHLYILIPLATLNRESAIALVVLYFVSWVGRGKMGVVIKRSVIYFLLWLIPFAILISIYGLKLRPPLHHIIINTRGLLRIFTNPNPYNHFYMVLYLCGFYWILAFRDFRKKDPFLKRAAVVMALHFAYGFFYMGAINEVRMFITFYVYVIPLGLFSLFNEDRDFMRRFSADG